MTVMADRSGRPAPVRRRMKTLTQAALNADKTVEQVEESWTVWVRPWPS